MIKQSDALIFFLLKPLNSQSFFFFFWWGQIQFKVNLEMAHSWEGIHFEQLIFQTGGLHCGVPLLKRRISPSQSLGGSRVPFSLGSLFAYHREYFKLVPNSGPHLKSNLLKITTTTYSIYEL